MGENGNDKVVYELRPWVQAIRDWWHDWPARGWINGHPRAVVTCATATVALLAVVIVWVVATWGGKEQAVEPGGRAWFYDLNTGELFISRANRVPPIKTPSGPMPDGTEAGVRAHLVSFGQDDAEPIIAYLETCAPDADKQLYLQSRAQYGEGWGRGMLVRRVYEKEWVAADSPKGRAIVEQAMWPDKQGRIARAVLPK